METQKPKYYKLKKGVNNMFDVRIIDNTDDARDEYDHWWGGQTHLFYQKK